VLRWRTRSKNDDRVGEVVFGGEEGLSMVGFDPFCILRIV